MEEHKKIHPSFGQLSIHRITSGGRVLYGSSLRHTETIRMRLSSSEAHRSLNNTRYFPSKTLFEIEMSPQQFAQMITTMNRADGTPVTILRTQNGEVEGCPYENERETFSKEFKKDINDITSNARGLIKKAEELLNQKSVRKSDLRELLSVLRNLKTDLSSNLSFVETQFQEATDRAVSAGKHEIESFWQNTIENLGVQKLAEGMKAPILLTDSQE